MNHPIDGVRSVLRPAAPGKARLAAALVGSAAALAAMLPVNVASAQCTGFSLTTSTGNTITPGVTDIGNHCDDCVTTVPLPFPVTLYGAAYSSAAVSSNGTLQFTTASNSFSNACLPQAGLGVAVMAHWDDLRTDGAGNGIFTTVLGTAPNRVFVIEWRTVYFGAATSAANFAVQLYEDPAVSRVDVIYGAIAAAGASATTGVQHPSLPPTQYSCNTATITSGLKLSFNCTNGSINPGGSAAATPAIVSVCGSSASTLFTVAVTPGLNPTSTGVTVSANLSSLGGSVAQAMFDDGTNGDVTAGDNSYSFRYTIPAGTPTGPRAIQFAVADAQGRSGAAATSLQVNACPERGPDVWISDLLDIGYYGAAGGITAYSVGTNACNLGDVPVAWFSTNNQHPVIAQNMYRLKNGRFEQIGQSWLKHGFASTNSGGCGTCESPPAGGSQLGVNCSDAYGAGLNGAQGNLGPRSQVNATTGAYPYPYSAPAAAATIGRRLQVLTTDVTPALNAGAVYFVEGHYVTADDARWNNGTLPATNGLNNTSYRRINVTSATSVPAWVGGTSRRLPILQAWKDVDPAVVLAPADYVDLSMGAPGIVARFWVAAKVTANGNGTWRYEYAVHNLNSDRAGGSFSVPLPAGVTVSNIGFKGVFAHSGEPYPNTAANPSNWVGAAENGVVTWTCPQAYNPATSGNDANALRWGTLYNFWFDASTPPRNADATVGLFKPGSGPAVASAAAIPAPQPLPCPADIVSVGGQPPADGLLTGDDFNAFISAFAAGELLADVVAVGGLPPGDGLITGDDFNSFIASFAAGCP